MTSSLRTEPILFEEWQIVQENEKPSSKNKNSIKKSKRRNGVDQSREASAHTKVSNKSKLKKQIASNVPTEGDNFTSVQQSSINSENGIAAEGILDKNCERHCNIAETFAEEPVKCRPKPEKECLKKRIRKREGSNVARNCRDACTFGQPFRYADAGNAKTQGSDIRHLFSDIIIITNSLCGSGKVDKKKLRGVCEDIAKLRFEKLKERLRIDNKTITNKLKSMNDDKYNNENLKSYSDKFTSTDNPGSNENNGAATAEAGKAETVTVPTELAELQKTNNANICCDALSGMNESAFFDNWPSCPALRRVYTPIKRCCCGKDKCCNCKPPIAPCCLTACDSCGCGCPDRCCSSRCLTGCGRQSCCPKKCGCSSSCCGSCPRPFRTCCRFDSGCGCCDDCCSRSCCGCNSFTETYRRTLVRSLKNLQALLCDLECGCCNPCCCDPCCCSPCCCDPCCCDPCCCNPCCCNPCCCNPCCCDPCCCTSCVCGSGCCGSCRSNCGCCSSLCNNCCSSGCCNGCCNGCCSSPRSCCSGCCSNVSPCCCPCNTYNSLLNCLLNCACTSCCGCDCGCCSGCGLPPKIVDYIVNSTKFVTSLKNLACC